MLVTSTENKAERNYAQRWGENKIRFKNFNIYILLLHYKSNVLGIPRHTV